MDSPETMMDVAAEIRDAILNLADQVRLLREQLSQAVEPTGGNYSGYIRTHEVSRG